MPTKKTLEDILKQAKYNDTGELREVLKDFLEASDRAKDDRADRFVSAIEGIERIANMISDASDSFMAIDRISKMLAKSFESIDKAVAHIGNSAKVIGEFKMPDVQKVEIKNPEVKVTNHPEPLKEVSIKKPAWWKFSSNNRLEGLIVGLRHDMKEIADALRDHGEEKGGELPALPAGVNMIKRDRRRRSKYAVAPKETADGTITTFTWPDNWVSGSMRIYVGTGRVFKESNDWKELGNRQISFTIPPPNGQTPRADYEAT